MSASKRRPMTPRKAGLLFALAFALIAAGVTLFLAVRSGGSSSGKVLATNPNIGKPAPPPPPDKPTESGQARLQFVRKDDPTKAAGELSWSSLEPLEERGRSLLTEPRAWVYFKDGRTLHVQAPKGRVYRPDQAKQIESGRFEGGVVFRLYEPSASGKINPETDRPVLLGFVPSLSFDASKGEASTSDPVQISTVDAEFTGTGLLVTLNQVRERLEYFEITKNPTIRYAGIGSARPRPAPKPAAPAGPATPAATDAPVAATPTPASQAAVRETLYRASFGGDVRLTQAKRKLAADNLDIWVRMVNNQLPPGAIAWGQSGDGASTGGADKPPAGTQAEPSAAAAPAPPTPIASAGAEPERSIAAPASDTDMVLACTGPLIVRPLEIAPPELEHGNHVALRFTADKSGAVAFEDTETGLASGRCAWIGYAATTRDLTLAGPGPTPVALTMTDGKRATVGRFETNLGTGIAHIAGGGAFEDGDRRIVWSDQSDMEFGTERGTISGSLRSAAFTGAVLTKDRRSSLTGDFLKATFAQTPAKATALSRLIVDGNAIGETGEGTGLGRLKADGLDVAFQPTADGKTSDPSVLTAKGKVVGTSRGKKLTADFLEVGLARGEKDRIDPTDVRARGSVTFDDQDRALAAAADELTADVPRSTALLTGANAWVSSGAGTIRGAHIDLDGDRREALVKGPGRFQHSADKRAGRAPAPGTERMFAGDVEAQWTTSMRFTDSDGVIDCLGGVVATSGADTLSVEQIRGERLRLELTPGTADGPIARSEKDEGPRRREPDRQLVRADVYGSAVPEDGKGAAPVSQATAERRRYVADAAAEGGKRLEQFVRLNGERIEYRAAMNTVAVPGLGRAAIYDGRAPAPKGGDGSKPGASPDARGASLFTWTGGLSFDLNTGILDMRRSVNLFHRPINDDPPTKIECERLEATVRSRGESGGGDSGLSDGRGAELVRVLARNSVYVESGARKLLADVLAYDALAGTCEASATDDNRITIFDEARGTSVSARRMFWDMVRDRVEIKETSPIVAPR